MLSPGILYFKVTESDTRDKAILDVDDDENDDDDEDGTTATGIKTFLLIPFRAAAELTFIFRILIEDFERNYTPSCICWVCGYAFALDCHADCRRSCRRLRWIAR